MSTFFKNTLWSFLYVFAVVLPHRPRCTVLLYHSISDSQDFFAVTPDVFEKQMEYLKVHADMVSLDTVLAQVKGEPLKRDSVSVTFDDGYQDFARLALPILNRLEIPAAVFVLGDKKDIDREQLGNELPLLASEDFSLLQNPLITIGSHGISHRKLPKLSPTEAGEEVNASRIRIREVCGKEPKYLAYPKGSWSPEVAKITEASGYDAAFTVIETSVPTNVYHFAIPRVQIDSSTSFLEFKAKLTSAANWYYWLWRLFRRGML